MKTRNSAEAKRLKQDQPCLTALERTLRTHLFPDASARPSLLPADVLASVSLRPGLKLRRTDQDPLLNVRVNAHRCTPSSCKLSARRPMARPRTKACCPHWLCHT